MDKANRIRFFDGDKQALWDGMEIIHTGGTGIGDKGSVYVGDTLQVALSRQFMSMMYSYPNMIPLPFKEIERISKIVMGLNFDSLYGAFEWQDIPRGAKDLFEHSVNRYRKILTGQ